MEMISDKDYITGILEHNDQIINQIYKQFIPMVRKMIVLTGGSNENVRDVFQDAIIIIYRKIKSGELELNCRFSTYLYAVTKKLWIQELKLRRRARTHAEEPVTIVEEPDETEEYRDTIKELLLRHFNDLSDDCRKILRMYFNGATVDDIQLIMQYNTRHHTIDRKYRCKRSLIKRIISDPIFKKIKNEYTGENRILY